MHLYKQDIRITAPTSKFYQGPYGRLFPELPAWDPRPHSRDELQKHLRKISTEMIECPGELASDLSSLIPESKIEGEFGSQIPAGYTYFGQFIDHDITFDPATLQMRTYDSSGLLNFRTPRLDLDSVYGAGRAASRHLYQREDRDLFLIGTDERAPAFRDLPRTTDNIAVISDPRNDENIIVAQFHLAFLLAHNELVRRAREKYSREVAFEKAHRTLRWLYQHIVWKDFVVRIANDDIHASALEPKETSDGRSIWKLGLEDVYLWENTPFIPIEFSVAAFRFGHSMVRNSYQINDFRGRGNFVPVFDKSRNKKDLRGSRSITKDNSIQWDWFLPMTSSPSDIFPQKSRKIDTKLSNTLFELPFSGIGIDESNLAHRTLMRGVKTGLPSGTDVAKKLGQKPLTIDHEYDSLWYYILREAQSLRGKNSGQMLGRVGSIIVCSTIAGLLLGDPGSYLNIEPDWTPNNDPLLFPEEDNIDAPNGNSGDWTLASIIRIAGLPTEDLDFR